jgi:hypothetical protein
VTFLDEETKRVRVFIGIATSEALVCHVEEREVLFLLDDLADLLPLLGSGINTSGVVGACMKENHTLVRRSLQVRDHTIEVETNGVFVVVLVLLDLETGVAEDSLVVGPAGIRDVDGLAIGIESLEECTSNSQSTSA